MRPSSVACDQYVPCVVKDLWWIWILASHFQEVGRSFPRIRPLAWHAHAGGLQTASCLWLRPRITDRPEFSSFQTQTRPQTLEGVIWSCWRQSPKCCPDKSLPGSLVAWKQGRFGAWPAFALACSRSRLLLLLLSTQKPLCLSIQAFLLPKSSQRQNASGSFGLSPGRTVWPWRGVCWNRGDLGCSGSWPHRQPVLRTIGR